MTDPRDDLQKEIARLRKENKILRENGLKAVRTRKLKPTTNSNYFYGFAPGSERGLALIAKGKYINTLYIKYLCLK